MGHLVGKDVFQQLGKKIDSLPVRAPVNKNFHAILKELFSEAEATFVVKMPYSLSTLGAISKAVGLSIENTQTTLESLCKKGLVVDLFLKEEYQYIPAPFVIGIFEFTMMRTGPDVDIKKMAKLFHAYTQESPDFYLSNLAHGETISIARALPHEGSVAEEDFAEVLDYEKATEIVKQSHKFSLGICSCRHEHHHTDDKKCDVPLKTCTSMGTAADYLIRNNLAEEISKTEMLELLASSREQGLVFNADNVKKRVSFICHCCACCCHMLLGISKFGYTNAVKTSSFLATITEDICNGCSKCAKACPISAIDMINIAPPESRRQLKAKIKNDLCLGCGVCVLKCAPKANRLKKRKQAVFYPEDTFERVILQSLEHNTLQYQLFSDANKVSHKFMQSFLHAFLKLTPVKRALMSDLLRSRFLNAIRAGAKLQKRERATMV